MAARVEHQVGRITRVRRCVIKLTGIFVHLPCVGGKALSSSHNAVMRTCLVASRYWLPLLMMLSSKCCLIVEVICCYLV